VQAQNRTLALFARSIDSFRSYGALPGFLPNPSQAKYLPNHVDATIPYNRSTDFYIFCAEPRPSRVTFKGWNDLYLVIYVGIMGRAGRFSLNSLMASNVQ
jgi:hypothetical protein